MSENKKIIEDEAKNLLKLVGFEVECSTTEHLDKKSGFNIVNCAITVEDDSSFIIGQYGVNLQALESLLRIIIFKKDIKDRVILDINGYREEKKENIKRLALSLADQVARNKKPQILKPMNAFERREVHLALENDNRVLTESIGVGAERKVIIKSQGII
jgi:predicted RNA-binding protein Jag